MLFKKKKQTGVSLVGLGVIVGVLAFTGAGTWLWSRVKQLDDSCYAALAQMGTNTGGAVCHGVSRVIGAADDGVSRIGAMFKDGQRDALQNIGGFAGDLLDRLGNSEALSGLVSSGDELRAMIAQGPVSLPTSSGAGERLRAAVDQFVIGQHYLSQSATGEAMNWFRQSASQHGGYGVLSQLTLGDMYSTGSFGVSSNNQKAEYYYREAIGSIQQLQASNSPAANQALAGLPADPNVLVSQLRMRLEELR